MRSGLITIMLFANSPYPQSVGCRRMSVIAVREDGAKAPRIRWGTGGYVPTAQKRH